jgi:hypothetical protein
VKPGPSRAAGSALLVFCCAGSGAGSEERAPASPAIHVESLVPELRFPDAAAPDALRRVCAQTEDELQEFFRSRGAPFEPGVVRSRRGRRCHIDYTPTLPGFRADPEDAPIQELFVNVESLSFLARRTEVFGDALDISKAIVARLPRPLRITLGVERDLPDRWYEEAVAFHYPGAADRIEWRQSRVPAQSNPWVQDFLKSGRAGGERRILVTRQLFEGRAEDGAVFAPMLDALRQERFVRSRLSWEGGDLQFARHPLDPGRLVLFFGDSARAYWGEALEQDEYAYVLKREFGADLAVDLSGLVPHVDYFLAVLPADRIALVSQPVSGRRELAEAAASALEQRFGQDAPPVLLELRQRLAQPDAFSEGRRRVEQLLRRAQQEAREGWPRHEDPELGERLARHLAARCPETPSDCFADAAVAGLLRSDPALLRDWAQAALRDRTEAALDVRLLSVVESQLSQRPVPTQGLIDAKVRELEELGFRVVRVPRLGGDRSLKVAWSGISYVNALLVDEVLFLPRFGLGEAEQRIFDELGAALPDHYQLVPVPARHMLLFNGGVHCSVAEVRE